MAEELKRLRFLWSGFVFSVLILFLGTRLIEPSAFAAETVGPVMAPILTLLSVANVLLSFLLPRFMKKAQGATQRLAFLVALALCEVSALFGFLLHSTAGWSYAWIIFLIVLGAMALHYPRDTESPLR